MARHMRARVSAVARGAYLPLIVAMLWVNGTVLLYAVGPFIFDHRHDRRLYVYLALVHIALLAGYLYGAKRPAVSARLRPEKALRICVVVAVLFHLVASFTVSPVELVSRIRAAIEDPHTARTIFINNLGTWKDYLAIFVGPFVAGAIPLGIVFWRRVGWGSRATVVFLVTMTVLRSVSTASRHGLWQLMILCAASAYVAIRSGRLRIPRTLVVPAGAAGLALFILYSNFIAVKRRPEWAGEEYGWTVGVVSWIDFDSPFITVPPPALQPVVMQGILYFTHGYEGLALALEQPFYGSLFGAGQSMFLARNAARLFGPQVASRWLPYRVQVDLDYSETLWMTAYPWFAADVTFPGTILLMALVGAILAASYNDAVRKGNPYAVVMFAWTSYFVASLPQGSITQDGAAVMSFYGWLAVWLFSRLKIFNVAAVPKHVRAVPRLPPAGAASPRE